LLDQDRSLRAHQKKDETLVTLRNFQTYAIYREKLTAIKEIFHSDLNAEKMRLEERLMKPQEIGVVLFGLGFSEIVSRLKGDVRFKNIQVLNEQEVLIAF
jgi:hypothetical protein